MVRHNARAAPLDGAPLLADPPPDKRRVRYAPDVPFPAYRYVPGSGLPHPTQDPAGHSHRTGPEPPHAAWTPHLWMLMPSFLLGVDLYNHAYFWEAHEAWEGPWQVTEKSRPAGLLLQALIQVAAGMLKVHLGSVTGARALWTGADARLEAVQGQHTELMGLRLRPLRKDLGAFFRPLERGDLPDLSRGPPLILPER